MKMFPKITNIHLYTNQKFGYAAVIILLVFVKAVNGICNRYFAQQKFTRPFR